MSFGDGNLRERVGDLNRQVDKLQRVNGELCAEINRQERRIRELECESGELRGYIKDLISCLDEIYKPENIEVVREIIDYCDCNLEIEVNR